MRRCLLTVLLLIFALAALGQEAMPKQALRFGIRVAPASWPALESALAAEPCDEANPVGVTLFLPAAWAQTPNWPAFDAAVKDVELAHARLCVATQIPVAADDPATVDYLARLSEHAESADTLALSLDRSEFSESLTAQPDQLAFLLKQLITALRGRSHAKVLIGEITPEALPLMDPLYERDFRAYVEGYTAQGSGPTGEANDEVVRYLESHHLGAPLLIHLPRVETPIAAQLLVLLSASRDVSFTDMEASDVAAVWHALVVLRSRLSPQMAQGFSVQATEIRDASGPRPDVAILNFFDPETMVQAMVLVPLVAHSKPAELALHLPTGDVTAPAAYPMPEGSKIELGYTADQKKGETVIRVPWQGKALLVIFERLKTGTVGEERLSVMGAYRIPVEVILARYQAVQQPQDVFLDNYTADAEVDYHFKLPGGVASLDVTFLNSFFYQKGTGARWVQNKLLLNGVAWKGKRLPELPIIEPEKVNTLPLTLTLGRDYSYRYIKDEPVDGRECYVVEFLPMPGAKGSLYEGQVWIDKQTYVKLKMRVRQTKLEAPQVSNDETDYYTAVSAPDGRTFYLLTRLEGQQIFSIGGTNVVAEREIHFTHLQLNNPAFKSELDQAEASDKVILEDTSKGLRYLKKEPNGTRVLQMEPKTGKWFAVAGTYYDQSLDYPLPLLGVNYFDYDYKKTKTQVNLLIAGAVNTLTVAKVNLLPRVDASANGLLFAIPFQDRVFPSGEEDKAQRVKILREYANAGLGWRFTDLSKLTLQVGAMYYRYSRDSKTAPTFRLPKDHVDFGANLHYSYSRRGWSASAEYDLHHRSAWEPWGPPGTHADVSGQRNYALWNLSGSKSFYLPYFQKISVSATWMDGRDLDRFSRYQFSYLGRDSLSGFAGSGVRFDRGAVARLAYDFNVANVVRFGLRLDQGRVQPVKGEALWQNHTGLGLSGAVAGPWQTYWTLDTGYALRSDIPGVKHDYTVALMVLKLW